MKKDHKLETKSCRDELRSCGFLIYRDLPPKQFLLMKHVDRWDLPKGHLDPGENDMQCALRELAEETGIQEKKIEVVDGFRFELKYQVCYQRNKHQIQDKTLLIFLAKLCTDVEIILTEHIGYQWMDWKPGLTIQKLTIDPLLRQLDQFWQSDVPPMPSKQS